MTTSVPAARGPRLADRVAIVTGAGSRADGIGNGRATAILLAREGARVALIDAMPEWAEQTRLMIEAEGGQSMVVPCDVTDPAAGHRQRRERVGRDAPRTLQIGVSRETARRRVRG